VAAKWLAAAAALGAPAACAQTAETRASLSLTPVYEGSSSLDGGGDAGVNSLLLSFNLQRVLSPQWVLGASLQYGRDHWRFSGPSAFGAQAPWEDVNRFVVSVPVTYLPSPDWRFTVSPQLEYAGESGASASQAYGYGALLMAAKTFGPELTLGLGLGAYRGIGDNSYFPVLIVDWRIDPQWRLSNPFPAGPAGGAGLELSYVPAPGWELGLGGTWRSLRFRLKDSGPVPGGIGQYRLVPVYLRAGYSPDPSWQASLYAGASLASQLRLDNPVGDELISVDKGTAPIVGLTLTLRF
jgi:hypothetical protein